jgi:membrane fusion protein, heavy metal efflux system
MKKRIFIYTLIITGILVFSGFWTQCGQASKETAHNHNHETADHDHSHDGDDAAHSHQHDAENNPTHRCIEVKPEIIKQWGLQYEEAVNRDYVEKVTLTGVVKENKDTTYIVNALVSGIVTAVKKDVGDTVKKGDVLCILNSYQLMDKKSSYVKAFEEYRLTRENYERAKKLHNIKAIEKKELLNRETAYKTAMAEFFSLEAELETLGFSRSTLKSLKEAVVQDKTDKIKSFLTPFYYIPAPAPGKIMMRDLSLGERIENSRAIFEVSDTSRMWVILDALEKDLPFIGKGKPVQINTDIYPDDYFTGTVLTLMEKIDPELRTLKVRVGVDNTDGRLKPEMYVRGLIEKHIKHRQVAIPSKALVKIAGIDGIFVIAEGEFLFKAVQVVETDSAGFAFVNGVKAGEMVVTNGAFYLKAEYEIQSGKGKADPHAGHNH